MSMLFQQAKKSSRHVLGASPNILPVGVEKAVHIFGGMQPLSRFPSISTGVYTLTYSISSNSDSGLWYRRVTEIRAAKRPREEQDKCPVKRRRATGPENTVNDQDHKIYDEEDEIGDFQRVQIVEKTHDQAEDRSSPTTLSSRRFRCWICGADFPNWSIRDKHIGEKHPGWTASTDPSASTYPWRKELTPQEIMFGVKTRLPIAPGARDLADSTVLWDEAGY